MPGEGPGRKGRAVARCGRPGLLPGRRRDQAVNNVEANEDEALPVPLLAVA
jgi:hypothetical protein